MAELVVLAERTESQAGAEHVDRYDDETRELARQLWTFRLGRNAERVAEELRESFPRLEARTVRYWATRDRWAERAAADIAAIAPALHQSIVVDLIAGAGEGVQHLRAVARGEVKAEPARVNASVSLLHMAGYAPRPGSDPKRPEPPERDGAGGLAGLPAEEVRSRLLRSLGVGT